MKFKAVPQRTVIAKVPSGEIALEYGGDGVFLRFDCDCLDALPYCKAACCSLDGIEVENSELGNNVTITNSDGTKANVPLVQLTARDHGEEVAQMKRSSDGFCHCMDRSTRTCGIYKDRPATCREFHCTRGTSVRGWKLDFVRHVTHQE